MWTGLLVEAKLLHVFLNSSIPTCPGRTVWNQRSRVMHRPRLYPTLAIVAWLPYTFGEVAHWHVAIGRSVPVQNPGALYSHPLPRSPLGVLLPLSPPSVICSLPLPLHHPRAKSRRRLPIREYMFASVQPRNTYRGMRMHTHRVIDQHNTECSFSTRRLCIG